MNFRTATQDDLPQIAALLSDDGLGRGRESADIAVYQQALERMQTQPGNVYLLAVSGGDVLACLQYTVIHGLSRAGASRAQIEGVRVSATQRGQGLGQQLMQVAIQRAREDGCTLVQLTSDRSRTDALRFYERLGFVASHNGMKLDL